MKYCRHSIKKIYGTKEGVKWCSYCGAIWWRYAKKWQYPDFWKRVHDLWDEKK